MSQEIGIAEAAGRLIVPVMLDRDVPPPGFILARKYIPAYEGFDKAMIALNELIQAKATSKILAAFQES